MKTELAAAGVVANVVAVNVSGAESTQELLRSRCSFDLFQDTTIVNAWSLMGGSKDDMFVYRQGGRLAPGGYLQAFGDIETDLSTDVGYSNVFNALKSAAELGPSAPCENAGGSQLTGDANQDSRLGLTDAVILLGRLFLGAQEPLPCDGRGLAEGGNLALHDVNADSKLDLADAVYLLSHLFTGGPAPPGEPGCRKLAGCPDLCSS